MASKQHPVALIRAERVSKIYHPNTRPIAALDTINLRIHNGEFVAITGASGSGKTTLMNLIGLLDTPSSGALQFEGYEVGRLSSNRLAELRNRRIGFVFQAYSLLARSTALENVELPLIYAGVDNAQRKQRARAALAQVGLADRCQHWPTQLSGGEQQRVAIARALVTRPTLILADEPTGALDSRTGGDILQLFQHLNQSGTAILLVTHDPHVAGYAQRRIELKDGHILDDRITCQNEGRE